MCQDETIQVMDHQPEREAKLMAWVKVHEGKLTQNKSVIDTGTPCIVQGQSERNFTKT